MMEKLQTSLWVAAAYWRGRKPRRMTRDALERWQDRRVQSHLRYVMARSEYYRQLFAGRPLADWRSFPISDKQAMMANFGRYNTRGVGRDEAFAVAQKAEQTRDFRATLRGVTVGLSSGTSGSYSLFLSSPRENGMFIGTALARLLRTRPTAGQRIAFFHRAHSNLYRGLDTGRIRYAFFDLMDNLEHHYLRLEELSPTLVIGPPFALRHLGAAKRSGQLRIDPQRLLSIAEVLEDHDREWIENDFGVAIDEAYVATEGFIAATCARGSLHVNEDLCVMQREWVDSTSGRFVPIITDFRRRVQPIIRYRLDDVLVEGRSGCDCGSPFAVLERIEGRRDDVLVFEAASGDQPPKRVFPDFVRRAVCLAATEIFDYRVIQESTDRVIVELTVGSEEREDAERAVLAALLALLARLECKTPNIVFRPPTHADARSKVRRVVREFSTDW